MISCVHEVLLHEYSTRFPQSDSGVQTKLETINSRRRWPSSAVDIMCIFTASSSLASCNPTSTFSIAFSHIQFSKRSWMHARVSNSFKASSSGRYVSTWILVGDDSCVHSASNLRFSNDASAIGAEGHCKGYFLTVPHRVAETPDRLEAWSSEPSLPWSEQAARQCAVD
jgi:hypothetical protein